MFSLAYKLPKATSNLAHPDFVEKSMCKQSGFFNHQNYVEESKQKHRGYFDYRNNVEKSSWKHRGFFDQENYTKKIHGNNEDFSTTELTSKKVRRNKVNGLRYIDVIWTSNQRGVPVGPMDTSLSICHRFDVEIPREKFFEISLISKGESTWKL